MDRVLAGTAGTIDLLNYDSNGALADAGGGDGTANVRSSDRVNGAFGTGTLLAGSPFTAARQSTGLYRIGLPASLATLDVYDVSWSMPDTTTRESNFEMVGSYIYTIAGFRAFDAALVAGTYPADRVRDIREAVEERFATCAQVSFTKRGRRDYLDGDGTNVLFTSWPQIRRVVSVKIDGTAQTLSNVKSYDTGRLELLAGAFNWGRGNVEVLYEHGYDPPPSPVVEAGKRYGRELIVKGAFDDMARATSIQTDIGIVRISQAGQGRVGIPEVDAVLAEYGYAGALIG